MTEMLAKEDILLELRPSVALFSCEAFKDAGSIACPGNLSQCCTTLLIKIFFLLIMYSLNQPTQFVAITTCYTIYLPGNSLAFQLSFKQL